MMVLMLILHVFRVYLTGGFKRPRELTWVTGVTMAVMQFPSVSPVTPCPGTSWLLGRQDCFRRTSCHPVGGLHGGAAPRW